MATIDSAVEPRPGLGGRVALAAASTGTAAIHAVMASAHLGAAWEEAAFFGVVAALQLAFAAAVLLRPSPALLLAGAGGNAVVLAVWIVSRTTGLPVGAHAGQAMSLGVADGICQLLQLVLVAGSIGAWLGRTRPAAGRPGPLATAATWAVAAAVLPLTAVSVEALAEDDHGHEATHGHVEDGHGSDDGHAHSH